MKPLVREILITALIAIAIFVGVRVTTDNVIIPSSSMVPTLEIGQRLIVSKVHYGINEPERGDIITFHPPHQPDDAIPFIKRIIGLPGDTIEIKNGVVFINGNSISESYINEPPGYKFPQFIVPEGEYFVLGDNRNNSSDSHLGWTLPRDNIIGKVLFTYWPPQEWHAAKHYSLGVN